MLYADDLKGEESDVGSVSICSALNKNDGSIYSYQKLGNSLSPPMDDPTTIYRKSTVITSSCPEFDTESTFSEFSTSSKQSKRGGRRFMRRSYKKLQEQMSITESMITISEPPSTRATRGGERRKGGGGRGVMKSDKNLQQMSSAESVISELSNDEFEESSSKKGRFGLLRSKKLQKNASCGGVWLEETLDIGL